MSAGQIYFGEFSSFADMMREFEVPEKEWPSPDSVLFAAYTYPSYAGDAVVILSSPEGLQSVEGGHCSCNGLEGQWSVCPTTVEALALQIVDRERLEHSYFNGDTEAAEGFVDLIMALQSKAVKS